MNKIKTGDKVKWGKRKGIFTVERLEEVDVVIVDQNRWEYPVSPSELTKVPKRAVKKVAIKPKDFKDLTYKVKVDVTGFRYDCPDCFYDGTPHKEHPMALQEEIDIPTNLRKVEIIDLTEEFQKTGIKKDTWPNGYTLAFVLAGIVFVIAYCVDMANI